METDARPEGLAPDPRFFCFCERSDHLLHPPLLDEVGLESAARWYADGFAKRCGLNMNLELSEIVNRLPKQVELALFRVLQESLTNVHRHANAKSIEIIYRNYSDLSRRTSNPHRPR